MFISVKSVFVVFFRAISALRERKQSLDCKRQIADQPHDSEDFSTVDHRLVVHVVMVAASTANRK